MNFEVQRVPILMVTYAVLISIYCASCASSGAIKPIKDNTSHKPHNNGITIDDHLTPSGLSMHTIGGQFYDVYFVNQNKGWATVHSISAILHTKDGGAKWEAEATPLGQPPGRQWYGLYFANNLDGWAVGDKKVGISAAGPPPDEGYIIGTTNGGKYWTVQKAVRGRELFGVSCAGSRDCWAVGQGGVVLNTSDGGRYWSYQNSGVSSTLYNVQFVNQNDGWAVGQDDTIIATTNGGREWTTQLSGLMVHFKNGVGNLATYTLLGLDFLNPQEGWVVGGDGQILHTADGGKTWLVQRRILGQGFTQVLHSVVFTSKLEGFAVGMSPTLDKRLILSTDNGGKTWRERAAIEKAGGSLGRDVYDVYFRNGYGWMTGFGNDGLYYSNDGGKTWKYYKLHFLRCERPWVLCIGG